MTFYILTFAKNWIHGILNNADYLIKIGMFLINYLSEDSIILVNLFIDLRRR